MPNYCFAASPLLSAERISGGPRTRRTTCGGFIARRRATYRQRTGAVNHTPSRLYRSGSLPGRNLVACENTGAFSAMLARRANIHGFRAVQILLRNPGSEKEADIEIPAGTPLGSVREPIGQSNIDLAQADEAFHHAGPVRLDGLAGGDELERRRRVDSKSRLQINIPPDRVGRCHCLIHFLRLDSRTTSRGGIRICSVGCDVFDSMCLTSNSAAVSPIAELLWSIVESGTRRRSE